MTAREKLLIEADGRVRQLAERVNHLARGLMAWLQPLTSTAVEVMLRADMDEIYKRSLELNTARNELAEAEANRKSLAVGGGE